MRTGLVLESRLDLEPRRRRVGDLDRAPRERGVDKRPVRGVSTDRWVGGASPSPFPCSGDVRPHFVLYSSTLSRMLRGGVTIVTQVSLTRTLLKVSSASPHSQHIVLWPPPSLSSPVACVHVILCAQPTTPRRA